MTTPPAVGPQLRVDPIACAGVGICAQVAAALVELDRWGYPVLAERPDGLAGRELRSAVRAVRACPRRALWLSG